MHIELVAVLCRHFVGLDRVTPMLDDFGLQNATPKKFCYRGHILLRIVISVCGREMAKLDVASVGHSAGDVTKENGEKEATPHAFQKVDK